MVHGQNKELPLKTIVIAALAAGVALASPTAADAALVITFKQIGSDILVEGAGSINTTGLKMVESKLNDYTAAINASRGTVFAGAQANTVAYKDTMTNMDTFGQGTTTKRVSSGTGNTFGISTYRGILYLPIGYVSGSMLSGTATYANTSFGSLGLKQGRYVFNLINNDTITVNVGTVAAVPEPATWAMMTLGLGSVGFAMRRRRKGAVAVRSA